jgi:hypothetical protein
MKKEVEKAVERLIEKSLEKDVKSHEALQFTQAALNLAHTAQVLHQVAG